MNLEDPSKKKPTHLTRKYHPNHTDKFGKGDWNLHPIDSHVAGAIGWSFMRLDVAWHEWILVALAVVIDGVLAVSAQCGCCHHFSPYFWICPFRFVTFGFIFFLLVCILLLYVL